MLLRSELNEGVRGLLIVENCPFICVDRRGASRADRAFAVCGHRYRQAPGRPGLPNGSRSRFRDFKAAIIAARLSRSTAQAGFAFSCWYLSTTTAPCRSTRPAAIVMRSMARIAVSRISKPAGSSMLYSVVSLVHQVFAAGDNPVGGFCAFIFISNT